MIYQTQSIVWGTAFIDAMQAALDVRPAAALLTTPKFHLSKDPGVSITPASVAATLALQESNMSGYTAGGYAVTLSASVSPFADERARLFSQLILRSVGSPDIGNIVYGWWIDGTTFVCGEVFATPIDLTDPSSYLDMLAVLALPTQLVLG